MGMQSKKMAKNVTLGLVIDRVALAKQGDYGIGSVRPSVRLSFRALLAEPFDLGQV